MGSVPPEGLPGDTRDQPEVMVVVQQREAMQLRGRRDNQVDRSTTPVLPSRGELILNFPRSRVSTVVDRHPAERGPYVLDGRGPIGRRSRTIEELQLGDRTQRQQSRRDRLIPAERLGAFAHEPDERTCVDEKLGWRHRR